MGDTKEKELTNFTMFCFHKSVTIDLGGCSFVF